MTLSFIFKYFKHEKIHYISKLVNVDSYSEEVGQISHNKAKLIRHISSPDHISSYNLSLRVIHTFVVKHALKKLITIIDFFIKNKYLFYSIAKKRNLYSYLLLLGISSP